MSSQFIDNLFIWNKLRNYVCFVAAHREIFSGVLLNHPEIRLYLPFSIKLEPNGRPFGYKSVLKWQIQSDFELI